MVCIYDLFVLGLCHIYLGLAILIHRTTLQRAVDRLVPRQMEAKGL
jgi:hypothetical protein